MGSEKFSLRWNDFESSISSSVGDLRDSEQFLDLTLVCGDDQIRAHKVIISACSPLFRSILSKNPHQNPLLYLKDVKCADMRSVLDFMYYGEVSIAQEGLNSFLQVAEELQVKGLTQKCSDKEDGVEKKKSTEVSKPSLPRNLKKHPVTAPPVNSYSKYQGQSYSKDQLEQQDRVSNNIKTEVAEPILTPTDNSHSLAQYGDDEYAEDDYTNYDDVSYGDDSQTVDLSLTGSSETEDLNQYVINQSTELVKEYTCALCQTFKAKLPSKVKNHLEAIHFPGVFLYNCDICGKTLKGRNALNIHKTTMHSKMKKY